MTETGLRDAIPALRVTPTPCPVRTDAQVKLSSGTDVRRHWRRTGNRALTQRDGAGEARSQPALTVGNFSAADKG
jgi:hypothetical protein